jgi:hypothetical protein
MKASVFFVKTVLYDPTRGERSFLHASFQMENKMPERRRLHRMRKMLIIETLHGMETPLLEKDAA